MAQSYVDRNPAPEASAQFVEPQQAKAKHQKGKCRSIVQAGLAGQREAKTVPVEWVLDLHVRGEHRIGRRQNCAHDYPDAPGQAQYRNDRRCDERDSNGHRSDRQANGDKPPGIKERNAQFEAGCEQRHDNGKLGDTFKRTGVGDDVHVQQPRDARAQQNSNREIQHGGREGPPRNRRSRQSHADEQHAGHDEPDDRWLHGSLGPRAPNCTSPRHSQRDPSDISRPNRPNP